MHHDCYVARDRIIIACLVLFVMGIAYSMCVYPGGTWWNPTRERHEFCGNFLCDLLHDPALNQKRNVLGALSAKISILALIIGLGILWTMAERWLNAARLAELVRRVGVIGTFSLALVPLTPSNHYPRLHTFAVLLGGLPSLAAFLLFCATLLTQSRVPVSLRVVSLGLSVLVLTCLGLYARSAIGSAPSVTSLPALERVAVVLLLVWVVLLLRLPCCIRCFDAQA